MQVKGADFGSWRSRTSIFTGEQEDAPATGCLLSEHFQYATELGNGGESKDRGTSPSESFI